MANPNFFLHQSTQEAKIYKYAKFQQDRPVGNTRKPILGTKFICIPISTHSANARVKCLWSPERCRARTTSGASRTSRTSPEVAQSRPEYPPPTTGIIVLYVLLKKHINQ